MRFFAGIALNRTTSAANRLTKASTYSSLMIRVNIHGYKASCAGCVTTPHGSNPTLRVPVIGLPDIIQDSQTLVLRKMSGPTDFCVGLGRFVFRVLWERR
jgi:hypothetical protein